MSRKRNVESEGGVVFIDPKMKALSSLDGAVSYTHLTLPTIA